MSAVPLSRFLEVHRAELILRCKAKVAKTGASPATNAANDRGIPLFLDRLVDELGGESQTRTIRADALEHGQHLFFQGLTVSQVVHDYGNVCQSIADLAVELGALIRPDDFRTLNRCLDDAIAGAVSEDTRLQRLASTSQSHELRTLINAAIRAFDAVQTGSIGFSGATGALLKRCLLTLQTRLDGRLLVSDHDL